MAILSSARPGGDPAATARSNALVLATATAFAGAPAAITITLGGLAGSALLGADKSLATLPVSGFNIGVAVGAIPAALLLGRVGRRTGFIGGTAIGAAGGLTVALSILGGSFVGLVFGTLLIGFAGAFQQQFRFAAADSAPDAALKAKAISWVMIGGVAAGVIGPQTVIVASTLLPAMSYAGPFVAVVGLMAIAAAALAFFRDTPRRAVATASASTGRTLAEIARQPRFIVTVACAIAAYGLMSLVMTAAPLAMTHVGHSQDQAALGIQWHVLAMFVPSFFTGVLIARFGKENIVATGLLLLVGCAVIDLAGVGLLNFWVALVLLGIGWNFGFIGATAMLTETYRPEEAGRAQGLNDVLVFGSVALASLASGGLLNTVGWAVINVLVFPVVAIALLGLAWLWLSRRSDEVAEPSGPKP